MKNSNLLLILLFSLFTISGFSQCTDVDFTTTITTAEDIDLVFWELINSENEQLLISEFDSDTTTVYTQSICLEDGCYIIQDYYFLGIFEEHGEHKVNNFDPSTDHELF